MLLINMGEDAVTPEDAVKRFKDFNLDAEIFKDGELIWVVGGQKPRNKNGGWDEWYFIATPENPHENIWVAKTWKNSHYELCPDLEAAIHYIYYYMVVDEI